MKFFGRQNEIKELQEIRNLSLQTARFTIFANGPFYNRNRTPT